MYLPCLSIRAPVRVYLLVSPGIPFACDLRSSDLLIHNIHHPRYARRIQHGITPPLDGSILPQHDTRSRALLPLLPPSQQRVPLQMHIRTAVHVLTLSELFSASAAGTLREYFCFDIAAVEIPAGRNCGCAQVPALALAQKRRWWR